MKQKNAISMSKTFILPVADKCGKQEKDVDSDAK